MASADREAAFHRAAERACARYGLSGPIEIASLAAGHNHVYRVDAAQGRFVLRLQPTSRMSGGTIAVLLPWLASARAAAGVVVPEPVPLPDGPLHSQVSIDGEPGTWWCVLLRWVVGDRSPTASDFVDPARLGPVGAAVARLHRHAEQFRPPTLADCRRKDAHWLTGPASALGDGTAETLLRPEDFAAFRAAAARVAEAMGRRGESPAHFGLIHADLEPGNWVFERGEPRPIDFDEASLGYYLFDLMGVLWSHAGWKDYPSYRSVLLDAYEAIRPLPVGCRAEADVFLAANVLAWLNHGLSQNAPDVRTSLLAHAPAAAQTLRRLNLD